MVVLHSQIPQAQHVHNRKTNPPAELIQNPKRTCYRKVQIMTKTRCLPCSGCPSAFLTGGILSVCVDADMLKRRQCDKRHRHLVRLIWLVAVSILVILIFYLMFQFQGLLGSTAGQSGKGADACVAAFNQAVPLWQLLERSSQFSLVIPPSPETPALLVAVWVLRRAERFTEVAEWSAQAAGAGLQPVILASPATVKALPSSARQVVGITWGPLPNHDMSPLQLAFHTLAWASQAARDSGSTKIAWAGFFDDSMVAHAGRVHNLMVDLQVHSVPGMVSRQTEEGMLDARTPLFVPMSMLARVHLPSTMPPIRGSNQPWLGILRNLVQTAQPRDAAPPPFPAGAPESLRHHVQRALQVPTPALEEELLASTAWEESSPLLAAAVVPGLSDDVAGLLVAEWDLQVAMQRQRSHLRRRVKLEWLHALPQAGHTQRPSPKDVWFANVDGNNIKQCFSTVTTVGLPASRLLTEVRGLIKAEQPSLALASVAIVWCRECVTTTVIASLPAPANQVLEVQVSLASDPPLLAVHSRDTSGMTLHAVVPFSCRYDMLHRLLENMKEAFTLGGFTGSVYIGWSVCDERDTAADNAQRESIQELYRTGDMQVAIVQVHEPMARSANINAAAASAPSDALLLVLDVDMHVKVGFLLRAVALVRRGGTAYFPVVWSKYNPEAVQAVEDWFGHPFYDLSPHNGNWREYGYGMVVMYKSDFDRVGGFDTSFKGWGGEDVAFYKRVQARGLAVLRLCDHDLQHTWHAKDCSSVPQDKFVSCKASWAGQEGGSLGVLVKHAPHLFSRPTSKALDLGLRGAA